MKRKALIQSAITAMMALWSVQGLAQIGALECRTDSRGYSFSEIGRDYYYTRDSVMANCRRHPSTRNQDCDLNVYCSGESNYRVSCDTFSRGYTFRDDSRDANNARQITIDTCKSHPSTVNMDCEYNIRCSSDGRIVDPIIRPIPIPQPIPPIVRVPQPPPVIVRPPVVVRPAPPVVRPAPAPLPPRAPRAPAPPPSRRRP